MHGHSLCCPVIRCVLRSLLTAREVVNECGEGAISHSRSGIHMGDASHIREREEIRGVHVDQHEGWTSRLLILIDPCEVVSEVQVTFAHPQPTSLVPSEPPLEDRLGT